MGETPGFFSEHLNYYRTLLLEKEMPFWLNLLDREHGGIFTCVDESGEIQSTDKFLWSQLRAVYTFATVYQHFGQKKEYLDAAQSIADFCLQHGRDANAHWIYQVSREGKILEGDTSIFSAGFGLIGLTALYRVAPEEKIQQALETTYAQTEKQITQPGSYNIRPDDLPKELRCQSIPMIFSHSYTECGDALGNETMIQRGLELAWEDLNLHLTPDNRFLYEYLNQDGSISSQPMGRVNIPGHAIEGMWFLIHIFQRYNEPQGLRRALECLINHVQAGWDETYGGLYGMISDDGSDPFWEFWDRKIWWAHGEALYGLLLGWSITQDESYLEWYQKIYDYSLKNFHQPESGRWRQRLDRQGKPVIEVVALPVLDPFHLPRTCVMCIKLLEKYGNP
jgi:N-acylglucosamine 2-epimerase